MLDHVDHIESIELVMEEAGWFPAGRAARHTEGAPLHAVRIYVKSPNSEAGDSFSTSNALPGDGDTLAAGVTGKDSSATGIDGDQPNNTRIGNGAAYVRRRTDRPTACSSSGTAAANQTD